MWLFEFVVGGWTRWWRHNDQPRLSSITKIFSRRISQSDWNIQIKLNYMCIPEEGYFRNERVVRIKLYIYVFYYYIA